MDYLTVAELAELKNCSVQYIKRICKDGKMLTELQPHPQNKQLCYMIPVSALPEDLQAKYYRKKKTEAGILPEKIESSNAFATALQKCRKNVSGILRGRA